MNKKHKQQKQHGMLHKHGNKGSMLTKEELSKLKEKYKAGKLKFNSRDIAEAMLNDPETKRGFTK